MKSFVFWWRSRLKLQVTVTVNKRKNRRTKNEEKEYELPYLGLIAVCPFFSFYDEFREKERTRGHLKALATACKGSPREKERRKEEETTLKLKRAQKKN